MRFCVFATASVPDVVTARRVHGLDDLDDKAVSKVLFHQRKQQTGNSEDLRWDQRMLAGMTMIQHSVDTMHITSHTFATDNESETLQNYFAAALRNGCMVSWNGVALEVPMIHFRSLQGRISVPAYWQAVRERADFHVSLCDLIAPPVGDRPSLDTTARKLGFPGMLGVGEGDVYAAWLQQEPAKVQAYSDLAALNTYLLALQFFSMTGQVSRHDTERVHVRLRDELRRREMSHFGDFAAAWRRD
ncbi:MAG: hypothetical protein KDI82_02300 [Gammaproteobacteria bacterium]|nr:hypothetical protein [Gammaproteobacteria bacterium]